MPYSGILRRVSLVRSDVSEEFSASIIILVCSKIFTPAFCIIRKFVCKIANSEPQIRLFVALVYSSDMCVDCDDISVSILLSCLHTFKLLESRD
jgi:hypothetical protein